MARKKRIKRERGEKWEPKIRQLTDRELWMVDLGSKFAPRKLYFATEPEAITAAAGKKAEFLLRLSGQKQVVKEKSAFNWFNLSNVQQNGLIEAYTACSGDTAKLMRAWSFHKKHTSTADASRLFSDIHEEYLAAKRKSNKRPLTLIDAEFKLRLFKEPLGGISISEITTADVERLIDSKNFSPSTKNAYRTAIVGLFNYAMKRRYTEHNPAYAIDKSEVDATKTSIHTPAKVRAMLTAASNLSTHESRAKMVPYLAIGYFAGLRPQNELRNLDWKHINFKTKKIYVDPLTAKKRRERYVDMSDNLIEWLAPYVRTSGKIGYSRMLFCKTKTAANVDWSKDVMRHSFGSYLLASNNDAGKTSLQMGHTGNEILFKNYRSIIEEASAITEYWSITPNQKTGIIQMPIAKAG